jgi:hypothetical protein
MLCLCTVYLYIFMFLLLLTFSLDAVLCPLGVCTSPLVFAVPIHDAPIEMNPKHITSVFNARATVC